MGSVPDPKLIQKPQMVCCTVCNVLVYLVHCRSDCELEAFTEAPSSTYHHTCDHTYSYDNPRRLSATSDALSLNYWPIPHCPASEPLTYFHPMLTPPTAVSLAPLIGCRASEVPPYFVQSPLIGSRTSAVPATSERSPLGGSRSDRGVAAMHQSGYSSWLSGSDVCAAVPLDLTVSMYQGSFNGSELTSTHQAMGTSRSGGVAEFPTNLVMGNSSSYVPSLMSHSFTSVTPLQRSVIEPTQFSESFVTSPAPISTGDAVLERQIPNRGVLNISTAASSGASLLLAFPASADTKPLTMDTSVVQRLEKLPSASVEQAVSNMDPQPSTSADLKPDISDQDFSGRLAITVPKVESSVQESLQPHIVTCSSPHYVQAGTNSVDIGQVSLGSSAYSVGNTSNTVADCHRPSEVNELPLESRSTEAAATDEIQTTTFSPAVPSRDDVLDGSVPGPETGVGLVKMEVDSVNQDVLGSAGVGDTDDRLLSSGTEPGGRASHDGVSDENNPMLPDTVQTSDVMVQSPADDRIVKPETVTACEAFGGHSTLSAGRTGFEAPETVTTCEATGGHSALDHPAEVSSKEPTSSYDGQRNALSAGRTGFEAPEMVTACEATKDHETLDNPTEVSSKEPTGSCDGQRNTFSAGRTGFEAASDVAISEEMGNDSKESLNIAPSGSEATDIDITDSIPVSAANTESSESKPVSGPAAVAMETSAPADEVLPPNVADSSADDAGISSAASTETEKNERFKELNVADSSADDARISPAASADTERSERFKELMMKCTKALELCLTRFPQHYKSLYHLADVFFRCSSLKVSHGQHT